MRLKVYELQPLPEKLDDRSWSATIIAKRCITFARNEKQARRNAAITFSIPVQKNQFDIRIPPWANAELVSCREIPDYEGPMGTEGQVIVGDCIFYDAVA